MAAPTTLFTVQDLRGLLGEQVDTTRAVTAERVVWGWLRPVLGTHSRPAEVSPELFSWALELGAIQYENPTGLSSYQLGQERFGYSSERRTEILAEVASNGADGASGEGGPRGTFPDPEPWPEPVRR